MYDFIIIGSGFGGSVFTLRLADEGTGWLSSMRANALATMILPKALGVPAGFCVRVSRGFGRGGTPFCFIVLLIKML